MKRKQRFDSLQSKEHYHKWTKEAHSRLIVSEIQSFINVKDVAKIVAGYVMETEYLLRFTETKKEIVNVMTGQVEFEFTFGAPYNVKTLWVKELNGFFMQKKKVIHFMQNKRFPGFAPSYFTGYPVAQSECSIEYQDMAYDGPRQSIILAGYITCRVIRLDVYLPAHRGGGFFITNRELFVKTKDRFQMCIINGNVVLIEGNENEDHININVWSIDLKNKLITDQTVLTQNWPLIIKDEIICSSSVDQYDQFYHFQKDGSFQRMFQNDVCINAQYRFAGPNVYKIASNLTCLPMTLHDPDLQGDLTIHSIQRTQCGIFIIGLFQRGISLEFSYRCYCELKGELWKVQDKQDLFHSKITHCLLLT
jgi:hypothetical protein